MKLGRSRSATLGRAALWCVAAIVLAGCSRQVETVYGRRSGPAGSSVNGTRVFAEMFRKAGHKVYSRNSLSPRVEEQADCIVWVPDDFQPPSAEVREWLESWLWSQSGRTLIYVGRDYDAGPVYWQTVASGAPAQQKALAQKRAAELQADYDRERTASGAGTAADCGWFTLDPVDRPRRVTRLQGDPGWVGSVDANKANIRLRSRFKPSEYAEVLLESEGDAIVTWEDWDGSQSLVLVNGSFVLNLPLVNHENRKLAYQVIDAVGPPGQTVVFLESGSAGPPIREDDPAFSFPTGLELFGVWPMNWILLHLAILGVIFCFSRIPIFGVPLQLPRQAHSDFGKHVDAMADLLARSRDEAYARGKLLHYRQAVRGSAAE